MKFLVFKPGSRAKLYLVTFAANLLYLSTGCVMAWPSPTLPKLSGVTAEEGSWIGSLFGLGAALGPALVAVSLDSLGRKATLLVDGGVFLVSWIILLSTKNLVAICIARVVGGVGVGVSFCATSVYIAEIADDDVRGAMGSVNQVFVGMGLLVQYCVGPYVSYTELLIVSACVTLLFGIMFVFMPESPYHLVNTEQKQKAKDVLFWIRGNPPESDVDKELSNIERNVAEAKIPGSSKSDIFTKKGPGKALAISLYLMFCQQVSAIDIMVSYTQPIFIMADMSLPSSLSPIIIGIVNVVAATLAPPIVSKFGLKNVLIAAGIVMGVCLLFLGIYFNLLNVGRDVSSVTSFPVIILMVYNVFFGIGMGPIPWTIVAELFPAHLKGMANGLVGFFGWLLAFAVMKCYQNFNVWLGAYTVFLFLGVASIVCMAGIWFVLPDTRSMSLGDIQDRLNGKKFKKKAKTDVDPA